MNSKILPEYKKRNIREKIQTILGIILAIFIIVIATLDITKVFKSKIIYDSIIVLFFLNEAILYKKYNFKNFILYTLIAIIFIISIITNLI